MPEAILHIQANRGGSVQEVIAFLGALERVYNHLNAFDIILLEAERTHEVSNIEDPATVLYPHEQLRLTSVDIKSPGFWEFLGNLNPLEVIRNYLKDRHERRKDIQYRNILEQERGELEIEKNKIELLEDKVDILRKVGVSEKHIRELLWMHIAKPLVELDRFQDAGMIAEAEIVEA